ncbi:MAG: preprotein translocase subunit SecY [Deltaproteobacteria bacterium]|nr:preprotein translocase subunit SecY [Deltaproteobacteria bacterium]MBI2975188.1 preprotein translocase subunit SecY [Deltaproteobacteria bacterium]
MQSVGNIAKIPELRKRIVFTLALLAVYRIGIYVPTPGINADALKQVISQGTVFDIFNLFSGGALERFSVFALGIMPYISASIIFQLLSVAVPAIERIQKEGESGRRKITQYTRYGTVVLSLVQGFGISYGLEQQGVLLSGVGGLGFYITTMLTLAAGTSFLMWLGEQISERGIGNGISMIIFAGIIARIPVGFRDAWSTKDQFAGLFGFLLLLAAIGAIIALIIFFERSQRRIPVQYAKRIVGRKMYGGQESHLPLKLNMAGVIPPIFASSLILFPATIAQFVKSDRMQGVASMLSQGWVHDFIYAGLIVFFCYFYTAVTFNPVDVAENMRKFGGYIPGIRPGKSTSDFIDNILTRITLGGAVYITFVCLLPSILIRQFGIPVSLASTFGGTSLLIVVGVAMDTVAQIEAHLLSRHYEGFLGAKMGGRFKGRRG